MKLFNVYPLMNFTPKYGKGEFLWDINGEKYLDFYGGHAVIPIGHAHPHYVKKMEEQLEQYNFYSNSVKIPIQQELADKLGQISGCENYQLFLCNSGAEANENALKLASFHTGKSKIVAFKGAFHGRTSGAVAVTDNPKIQAPFNQGHQVAFMDYDLNQIENEFKKDDVAGIIYEPIQGVGGIIFPSDEFVQELAKLCEKYKVCLIADEVQSGFGRTGKFFAHQYSDIQPDIISMAKGMGNGFPVGGILISPKFKASHGLLGTTFGGNPLACAASIAVIDVMEQEGLLQKTQEMGNYIMTELKAKSKAKEIRGRGLMIGIDYQQPIAELRSNLLSKYKILTGISKGEVLRILPPLNAKKESVDYFLEKLFESEEQI